MSVQIGFIEELIEALARAPQLPRALVGFDGYVDQIRRVVQTREGLERQYFTSLAGFGNHLAQTDGKSIQQEIYTDQTKLGGNAPIMANSLGSMGIATLCLGSLGLPIDSVFKHMPPEVTLQSLGKAGETTALEFEDAKLILSDVGVFDSLNWEYMKQTLGLSFLVDQFKTHSLVALVGWSNLPHAGDILSGIVKEVLPRLANHRPQFFFDLADPSRKSKQELNRILELIGTFSKYGETSLGLNYNEVCQLYQLFFPGTPLPELPELARKVYPSLSVDTLMLHPKYATVWVDREQYIYQEALWNEHPKLLTGAGDNLNAGFCLGKMLDLSPQACLIAGMAYAGNYVSTGKSGDLKALQAYLEKWRDRLV